MEPKIKHLLEPDGTYMQPLIKLRLESDGTYVAEDIGEPEFWGMAEGNRIYPQRIKFRPERGHWTLDTATGKIKLTPETSALTRWDTKQFRYDKATPDRVAWGSAFLERADK